MRGYDTLGRVAYEEDPYPASQGLTVSSQATTYYYNADGTPSCFISGHGLSAFTQATDEANEVYPTCFDYVFENNTEKLITTDAASHLAGSPQQSVQKATYFTAIGRPVETVTYQPTGGGFHIPTFLERLTFTHDALGHMTSMTRYQDPVPLSSFEPSAGSNPVTTTWHYDSLGQVLEFDEPDSAPQFRSYSNWGEMTQVQWNDTSTTPATDRRTIMKYDALGRVTHSEDQTKNVVDAETVNDYTYDQPATFVNRVTPTNVLGRLASASSPTSRVSLSYDGLGRVNARGFDNRHGNTFVEKHTYHGDGSLQTLDLLLPDNSFKDERVDYTYDSAGRARSVKYSDGTSSQDLFTASGSSDIDPFGRIRQAHYGLATYTASYADKGRRLLTDVKVASPSPLSSSREISYQAPAGLVTDFDPVGHERSRREIKNGDANAPTFAFSYDELGQLSSATRSTASTTLSSLNFTYDRLGNVLTLNDTLGTSGATLSYLDTDRDRICRIGYGPGGLGGTTCNVKYDGVGNIIEEPSRSNGKRTLSYFANGHVKKITDGNNNVAVFSYDAFGAVQQLTLTSNDSAKSRNDRHFGGLLFQRDEVVAGTKTSVLTRSIPGPGGLIATRHGPTGPWVFAFGEGRGNRFFTDQTGAFVQDVDYQPYGEATSTGAQPGSQTYSSAQWNGGDALAALGLSQLGARMYDPVIGRFLSRDPLLIPRTAATTTPYAFATNDPVNRSDPSGLDTCIGPELCLPGPLEPPPGSPYLPSSGNPHNDAYHHNAPNNGGHKTPTPTQPQLGPWPVSPMADIQPQLGPWPVSPMADPTPNHGASYEIEGEDEGEGESPVLEQISKAAEIDSFAMKIIERTAEMYKSHRVAGFAKSAGAAGHLIEALIAGYNFGRDPSLGSGYALGSTFVKAALLEHGGLWGAVGVGTINFTEYSYHFQKEFLANERRKSDASFALMHQEVQRMDLILQRELTCVEAVVCELPYGPVWLPDAPYGPWQQ